MNKEEVETISILDFFIETLTSMLKIKDEKDRGSTIGILVIQFIFIALKVFNIADFPWWLILSPLWMLFGVPVLFTVLILIVCIPDMIIEKLIHRSDVSE